MGFTTVPDKASGDVFTEAMWDTYIKDNLNTGIPVLLASSTLGASAASIDLTGIPQDWAHLNLIAYLRGDTAANTIALRLRFNADTGSNYDRQHMLAYATTVESAEAFGETSAFVGDAPAATATANVFSALTIDIPYYSQATNNKSATTSWADKYGVTTEDLVVGSAAIFWRSVAAITQVTLFPASGNFVSGSRVSLYGMP